MIVQLALLIKTRIAFVHRRWELVPTVLAELASSIGWSDSSPSTDLISGQKEERTWLACLNIHYLILRALWEGRIGNDNVTKEIMKRAYALMDETADKKVFNELRANGGVITVCFFFFSMVTDWVAALEINHVCSCIYQIAVLFKYKQHPLISFICLLI